MTSDDLARAIRARRDELGVTLDEIAASGGPSDSTMTKLSNGTSTPPMQSTLRKVDFALQWPAGSARRCFYDGIMPEREGPENATIAAIRADSMLTDEGKTSVIALYRVLVDRDRSG